jgi:hypothetical protein
MYRTCMVTALFRSTYSQGHEVVMNVNGNPPILEIRQTALNLSSMRDQRLRIYEDRVEFVHPKVISQARTITIPLADIDYVSVKRYALVWADLVIVPKSGTAIRLRPLGPTDAEHAESLIKRQLEKLQS